MSRPFSCVCAAVQKKHTHFFHSSFSRKTHSEQFSHQITRHTTDRSHRTHAPRTPASHGPRPRARTQHSFPSLRCSDGCRRRCRRRSSEHASDVSRYTTRRVLHAVFCDTRTHGHPLSARIAKNRVENASGGTERRPTHRSLASQRYWWVLTQIRLQPACVPRSVFRSRGSVHDA